MPSPRIEDELFAIIGEEVAQMQLRPGPMARAVAESNGNRDLVESLYIKFRFEELYRERGLDSEACPYCGHRGRLVRQPRGNWLLLIALFILFVVPGLIYLLACHGYKGVCANCRKTVIDRI
jgi:hypothetical protein